MASNKRSARQRQRAAFEARLLDVGDAFEREERRREQSSRRREAALLRKSCTSKNRYATMGEARAAISSCEEHGRTGLTCYRCPHCNGWHLTSHPR